MTLAQSDEEWFLELRAGHSGDLLPPSPPAEKATARQDQAGQSSTGDGCQQDFGLAGAAHRRLRDGRRYYGCRAVLLYSHPRLLMWKQTDKSPFRNVTINYFKGS
jgi:hypothetical protein